MAEKRCCRLVQNLLRQTGASLDPRSGYSNAFWVFGKTSRLTDYLSAASSFGNLRLLPAFGIKFSLVVFSSLFRQKVRPKAGRNFKADPQSGLIFWLKLATVEAPDWLHYSILLVFPVLRDFSLQLTRFFEGALVTKSGTTIFVFVVSLKSFLAGF